MYASELSCSLLCTVLYTTRTIVGVTLPYSPECSLAQSGSCAAMAETSPSPAGSCAAITAVSPSPGNRPPARYVAMPAAYPTSATRLTCSRDTHQRTCQGLGFTGARDQGGIQKRDRQQAHRGGGRGGGGV